MMVVAASMEPTAGNQIGERRQASRRRLHRPVRARLYCDESQSDSFSAVMLNVSPHGLALRAARDDFGGTAVINRSIRVVFTVDAAPSPFDLAGRVTNATEAATAGQVIMGMEFRRDENQGAELARLSTALAVTENRREGSVP